MAWLTVWRDSDKTVERESGTDRVRTSLADPHGRAARSGRHNVRDFGAVMDGATDDTAAIVAAIRAALVTGCPVYVPTGVAVLAANAVTITIPAGGRFTLYGDGRGSVIKRADGSTTRDGSELFNILATGAATSFEVRDLMVDDNARGNPLPDPATPYGLEHSHTFRLGPAVGNRILEARFTSLTITDPVADGISIATPNTIGTLLVDGLTVPSRSRSRSDVQFSAPVDRAILSNCDLTRIEMEWVYGGTMDLHIANVHADKIDLVAKGNGACSIHATGLTGTLVTMRGLRGTITGSEFTTSAEHSSDIRWTPGLRFNACTFIAAADAGTCVPLRITAASSDAPRTRVTFDRCDFTVAGGAVLGPNTYHVNIEPVPEATSTDQDVTFDGCHFSAEPQHNVYANKSGTVLFRDCDFGGRRSAMVLSAATGYRVDARIIGGTYARCGAAPFYFGNHPNVAVSLEDVTLPWGEHEPYPTAGTGVDVACTVTANTRRVIVTAPPVGGGIVGDVAQLRAPVAGPFQWVATTTNPTAATWAPLTSL